MLPSTDLWHRIQKLLSVPALWKRSSVAHEDGECTQRMLKLIRMAASYAAACPFCIDMNSHEHRERGSR